MRKFASARAEVLRAGGLRIVLASVNGEQVGCDLAPEDATRFVTGAMEAVAPAAAPAASPSIPPTAEKAKGNRRR